MALVACPLTTVEAAETPDVTGPPKSAILAIQGRPLAVFRVPLFGYSPQERASLAEKRIEETLAKPQIGEIRTMVRTEGTALYIGDDLAFLIAPGDLDGVAGETMDQALGNAVKSLMAVRSGCLLVRTSAFWVGAIWRTLAATAVFVIITLILIWASRRFTAFAAGLESRLLDSLKEQRSSVLQYLLMATKWTVRIVLVFVTIKLAGIWLTYCLKLYPYTYTFGERLQGYVFHALGDFSYRVLVAVPDIAIVIVIFLLARFLAKSVKSVADNVADGQVVVSWLSPEVAKPTARIVIVFIWMAAVVAAYPYVPGGSSEAFKGMGLLVGVIVSLGTPGVFAQVAAGLSMMYSRAFKAGEYVQIGDTEGTVISVGYLSTKIRTPRREEVNIPNAVMLTTSSRNLSRSFQTGMPLNVKVSIGYNAPWRQVHALLLEAALKTDGIRKEPGPAVFQLELADYYVVYELSVFIEVASRRRNTLSSLNANIQDCFNSAGVQIMSPHYVLDPAGKVWVPPDKWYVEPPKETDGKAREV
jgi:small-conductance mechanosensitive channel